MKIIDTEIDGVKIVETDVFRDARGYFQETYNAARYRAAGIDANFVQDNESLSQRGVLRGLHWQAAPHSQAKLVRVVRGAVFDVAVDLRPGSPTFGHHVSCLLTGENRRQFFLPKFFAHGFLVLEDDTLFSYKCDDCYCPEAERGMRFDDPELGIDWAASGLGGAYLLSPKDLKHPSFAEVKAALESPAC